jgi:hypothetical protein
VLFIERVCQAPRPLRLGEPNQADPDGGKVEGVVSNSRRPRPATLALVTDIVFPPAPVSATQARPDAQPTAEMPCPKSPEPTTPTSAANVAREGLWIRRQRSRLTCADTL